MNECDQCAEGHSWSIENNLVNHANCVKSELNCMIYNDIDQICVMCNLGYSLDPVNN